jgi:hypothetical protein
MTTTKKYRMLKAGDVIEDGDQGRMSDGCFIPMGTLFYGDAYSRRVHGVVRRPNITVIRPVASQPTPRPRRAAKVDWKAVRKKMTIYSSSHSVWTVDIHSGYRVPNSAFWRELRRTVESGAAKGKGV